MGERKGVNKYYPPDYDPSKGGLNKFQGTHALRERAKKIHLGILVIRFEMPYNIWCDGCGNHIGMGVRYNAEKSKVGMYYTTPVYQFRMKCHLCDNYFIIKTDPANLDYEVVAGARRQERRFDPGENGTVVPDERAKIQKLATDAMYKLEHGSDDVGKLRDAAPVLEHVERIQDRMWDDFAANKRLRDKFRAGKKAAAAVAARDADLLRRASLDLVLSPETDEDRRLAALMKLRDPVGLEERRKRKRAAIGARPALGTVAPRSGGFGTGRAAGTGGGRTAASIGVALGRSGGTTGSSPTAAAGDSERGEQRLPTATNTSDTGPGASPTAGPSVSVTSIGPAGPIPSVTSPSSVDPTPSADPSPPVSTPSTDPSPVVPTPAANLSLPGPAGDHPAPTDRLNGPGSVISPVITAANRSNDRSTTTPAGRISLVAEYSSTDSE
ncbi:coiled-coil domain-containing protein 130 homolog [Amphibalanus amphitrite]|uniref:coiled-coil domain-containing protein 130 homolog n=1 Tax=Amphibalanus amphitrite TaxID=1232801 RepID=UPI001C916943|nr:coiled-coil domain-containing protein 130 homolog [Amphibalanus amphitrite]XP_043223208.1 coiled-coil domain-containing protein 130 homolog [Amphibalanus amphitrite]XP_043223209.1 coiled-coil domain-containing protein 130 homolog [Amphibalanus amphitrite]XP_043223210.1 coiled-coil domain-containing protein 130 homolog [Amphibalanus amphitrite]